MCLPQLVVYLTCNAFQNNILEVEILTFEFLMVLWKKSCLNNNFSGK